MKQQHYIENGNNRFKTARERNRNKARFEIRERVDALHLSQAHSNPLDDERVNTILHILHKIVIGHRAFFSLKFFSENRLILSSPIPVDICLRNAQNKILMECMILSRFGPDKVQQMKDLFGRLRTCTFMEYCVWTERYHILSLMVQGGVNPCLRGEFRTTSASNGAVDVELLKIGTQALKKFVPAVPLPLSGHIIKRIVEMRYTMKSDEQVVCSLCRKTDETSMLSFGDNCDHGFHEACFWELTLNRLFLPTTTDAVCCPICCQQESTAKEKVCPADRYSQSLTRFLRLPEDTKSLRNLSAKKEKEKEVDFLKSSWTAAVKHSIGFSQAVRRDKFFVQTTKGSYHFVEACIENGIDLNAQNEYGQTALFIAVWSKYTDLVRLLLEHGSDCRIVCNAGHSPLAVALASGQDTLVQEILRFCPQSPNLGDGNQLPRLEATNPNYTSLISDDADHPGAGSFTIDDAIHELVIDRLVELWSKLPLIESKKKDTPCSVRSYYCDSIDWISLLLESVISGFCGDKTVVVFPHMRFLCYREEQVSLASHVDLNRLHPFLPVRSTHSFLLYLTTCEKGGETTLLNDLAGLGCPPACVQPIRGRLLVFPHNCPHRGEATISFPKLLVRGEVAM